MLCLPPMDTTTSISTVYCPSLGQLFIIVASQYQNAPEHMRARLHKPFPIVYGTAILKRTKPGLRIDKSSRRHITNQLQ